jgi:hypothetical protein
MLGVGACFGGELRKLRFLIRCEVDFHFFKIGESWCQATGEEKATDDVDLYDGIALVFTCKNKRYYYAEAAV